MSHIVLQGVSKYYGTNKVLSDVDLEILESDFMTLLGPSGCGKSTTLRLIAGLERPQQGRILMDGREVANADEEYFLAPSKRGLNLVFQSYALWPHMTVFQNVAFGLKIEKRPREEVHRLALGALERMQIGELSGRFPGELSGGQQQRVAIARAIASSPRLLLLDEPLSNLDAKLRIDMRGELKRLHRDIGTTIIYVTHDQAEALTLSTRIAVLFGGRVAQVAPPMQLYRNPATLQVADFIGNPRINTLKGEAVLKDGRWRVSSALGSFFLPASDLETAPRGSAVVLGFRPEEVRLTRRARDGAVRLSVYSVMPAGSETLVQVQCGDERFLVKQLGLHGYETDEEVYLSLDPGLVNLYDQATGQLLRPVAGEAAVPDGPS